MRADSTRTVTARGPGDSRPPGASARGAGDAAAVPAGATRRPAVAVLVVHGMGQQVPYETLGALAECLEGEADGAGFTVDRVALAGGPPLARVRLGLAGRLDHGEPPSDVHLYEGYWAPLVAGKATWGDAVAFLLSGFVRGCRSRLASVRFKRWMFGGMQELPTKPGTVLSLVVALVGLVLASLPALVAGLAWQRVAATASLAATISSHSALSLASFALLGAYAWALRWVLVEYVGDVAVYVSAHTVSRFDETRTHIQATVGDVLRRIYEATGDGGPLYDRVVVVGHSLGSVIAYDAVNAAIAWDRDERGGRMRVVERTSHLITFGSPLDKTAFLFRTQLRGDHDLREALAALKQPLILDYGRFRPAGFTWVNIYSRADAVSGPLAYYDTPAAPSGDAPPHRNPVRNVVDPWAWVPFVAHVQYWRNPLLREVLLDAVRRPPAGASER